MNYTKRILNGLNPATLGLTGDVAAAGSNILSQVVRFNIQAAVDAFYASADDFSDSPFPDSIAPWEWILCEWHVPTAQRVGNTVQTWLPCGTTLHAAALVYAGGTPRSALYHRVYFMTLFDNTAQAVGSGIVQLDRDGNIAADLPTVIRPQHFGALKYGPEAVASCLVAYWIKPVLFAFALANCRNVRCVETKHHAQKQRKMQDRPRWRHYTLVIDHLGTQGHDRSVQVGSMAPRALHLCRGHFKTFTETSPLFGRHVGRYWWTQSVRGSAEAGIVDKDYMLGKPK